MEKKFAALTAASVAKFPASDKPLTRSQCLATTAVYFDHLRGEKFSPAFLRKKAEYCSLGEEDTDALIACRNGAEAATAVRKILFPRW